MRPPSNDQTVAALRHGVPEFEDRYLDLSDIYGEDLTPEVVFMELADFLTNLLVSTASAETIDRCFATADDIVRSVPGGRELVGYALLNEMTPGARALACPYLSGTMDELLDRLEREESLEETQTSGPEDGR